MSNPAVQDSYCLYGIKNCDTIKKARRWLDEQNIAYRFHDYRSDGIDAHWLQQVIEHFGWEKVLNMRGTTWRSLSEEIRTSISDAEQALALLLEYPSMIKRPILQAVDGRVLLGFSVASYESFIHGGAA